MVDFMSEAMNIKDELISIRRDIHQNPELGFEEYRTSKIIQEYLKKEGIDFYCVAKTGVCAEIRGEGRGKKVIALRADMDALPIEEKNDCEYKSKIKGKMHACGHDAHTAILLGAAKILNKNKKYFSGTVKLLFEPAEETTGGALIMINEGVLKEPYVERIVGLHVSEDLDCGKIRVKLDMVNAASNPFTIRIKGKGGHGANPDKTVDPIIAASNVVMAIQTIASREVAPINPVVITIGSINGGTAPNIIPEEVTLSGIIRTITREDRIYVVKRLEEIIKGVCTALRAEGRVVVEEGYPCLYNDKEMVRRVRKIGKRIVGERNVLEQKNPSMGVESFAYFAQERPSVFYYLGTKNKKKGSDNPAHSNLFKIDEEALPIGVAMQCAVAFDYLTSL